MDKLLDKMSLLTTFDVFGAVVAGIGTSVLTTLLFSEPGKLFIVPHSVGKFMGIGMVLSGLLIPMSRIYMGRIREIAQPGGGVGTFSDRLKTECDKRKVRVAASVLCFVLGTIFSSIFLLATLYYGVLYL